MLWPVEAILSGVVANFHSHGTCRKLESSPGNLHNLGFAEVRMPILSDGLWFLVDLISVPPIIISNTEHLVLRLLRVFLPERVWGNFMFAIDFLEVDCVWN